MSRHKAYALSPRDCLKTTLFQKWQRIVAPPGMRGIHFLALKICSFFDDCKNRLITDCFKNLLSPPTKMNKSFIVLMHITQNAFIIIIIIKKRYWFGDVI